MEGELTGGIAPVLRARGRAHREAAVRGDVLKQRKQHTATLRTAVPKLCAKMPPGCPRKPTGTPPGYFKISGEAKQFSVSAGHCVNC